MKWSMRAPSAPQPWKRWFAWHPVQPGNRNEWVWLEWVERKRCYTFDHTRAWSYWEYRASTA